MYSTIDVEPIGARKNANTCERAYGIPQQLAGGRGLETDLRPHPVGSHHLVPSRTRRPQSAICMAQLAPAAWTGARQPRVIACRNTLDRRLRTSHPTFHDVMDKLFSKLHPVGGKQRVTDFNPHSAAYAGPSRSQAPSPAWCNLLLTPGTSSAGCLRQDNTAVRRPRSDSPSGYS
jgi:hypothetical protein